MTLLDYQSAAKNIKCQVILSLGESLFLVAMSQELFGSKFKGFQLSRWIALHYVRSFASPRTTKSLYSQPPLPEVGPIALAVTPQNHSTNSSLSNKLAGENVKQRARNIRGFSTLESTTTKRERVRLLAR